MRSIFFIIFCSILISFSVSATLNVTLSDQGTDVKYKSNGSIINSGNLNVEIYDALTGGNLVYNESFLNEIVNGSWNVILGENSSNALALEFGKAYYKDYKINGQDLDFTNLTGDTIERQLFYSPLGDIGGEDVNQGANLTIAGLNLTDNNITGVNYGFFSFLGSLASKVTSLFIQDINVFGDALFNLSTSSDNFNVFNATGNSKFFVNGSSGNIGIGTTSPADELTVAGNINITGSGNAIKFPDGTSQPTAASGVPSNAVMFFNLATCPSGWTALTTAQGRSLIGLPSAGTLAGTVGTALTNQEDRIHTHSGPSHTHATGDHTLTTSEMPAHTHTTGSGASQAGRSGPDNALNNLPSITGSTGGGAAHNHGNTDASGTGITGTAATSNVMPYIQLLVCKKD